MSVLMVLLSLLIGQTDAVALGKKHPQTNPAPAAEEQQPAPEADANAEPAPATEEKPA